MAAQSLRTANTFLKKSTVGLLKRPSKSIRDINTLIKNKEEAKHMNNSEKKNFPWLVNI